MTPFASDVRTSTQDWTQISAVTVKYNAVTISSKWLHLHPIFLFPHKIGHKIPLKIGHKLPILKGAKPLSKQIQIQNWYQSNQICTVKYNAVKFSSK